MATTPADDQTADQTAEDATEEREPDGKIRKKDIYNHVTVSTGLRKREVREAVDATLAYLHTCLSDGKDVLVPPMGKIRSIERGKDGETKIIHKVILQKPKTDEKDAADGKEALAEADNAD